MLRLLHGEPLVHDVDIGAARPDLCRLLAVQPPREHVSAGRHSKYYQEHSEHLLWYGHSEYSLPMELQYSHGKCSVRGKCSDALAGRQLLRDGHQVRHHAQRPVARAPALVRIGVGGEGAGGHCAVADREAAREVGVWVGAGVACVRA